MLSPGCMAPPGPQICCRQHGDLIIQAIPLARPHGDCDPRTKSLAPGTCLFLVGLLRSVTGPDDKARVCLSGWFLTACFISWCNILQIFWPEN